MNNLIMKFSLFHLLVLCLLVWGLRKMGLTTIEILLIIILVGILFASYGKGPRNKI